MNEVGEYVEPVFCTQNVFSCSDYELMVNNPLVHYLVEQILIVQQQNALIIEAFNEAVAEMTAEAKTNLYF